MITGKNNIGGRWAVAGDFQFTGFDPRTRQPTEWLFTDAAEAEVAQAVEAAVEASDGVQIYRQYVEAVGLGFSMTRSDEIEMPAYTGPTRLDYATPRSTTL